ncbi:hypothetical protein A2U01_0107608, partial [Trifolium medium]|nr:hypothetical protein [Trifolium medium]
MGTPFERQYQYR